MRKILWAQLVGLALAACTYRSDGEGRHGGVPSDPAPTSAASPAKPAAADPQVPSVGQVAADRGIAGIEMFDRQVAVVTVVCSSHTYDIRYSHKAAATLAPQLRGAALQISRVDVSLRCHPKGFANFESRCYASAEIGMTVRGGGGQPPRPLVVQGDGDAAAGALCEGGADAVDIAMTNALARASSQLSGTR